MDTMAAFLRGEVNRGKPQKAFDWDAAAKILVERGATEAEAGLEGDLEWTGGPILRDGKPVPEDDTYTYLSSTWATPVLIIGYEEIPCWRFESESGYDAHTYWPASALTILDEQTGESK